MHRLLLLVLLGLGYGLIGKEVAAQPRKQALPSVPAKSSPPQPRGHRATNRGLPAPPVVLASQPLLYEVVNRSTLRRDAEQWQRLSRSLAYNILYEPDQPPHLLYRRQPTDTVWVKVQLQLPRYAVGDTLNKIQWQGANAFPDTCNMDRQGAAEVRVTVLQEYHGAGSGAITSTWTAFNLLDISHEPRLLLAGLIERSDTGWGQPPPVRGRPQPAYSIQRGWYRPVSFGATLRLGNATRYRTDVEEANPLTRLRPGRYHYRHGTLRWVGP
jgi:hypothetical protein